MAPGAGENAIREFVTHFVDGATDQAAALLSEAGRSAVVESFPDGFGGAEMDAEDALEAYWWGLHGQYGPPSGR